MLRLVIPALAALALTRVSAEHVQPMIRRGDVKVRGVNLGGWLVGEHWMSYNSPAWTGIPNDVTRQGEWKTMESAGHAKGDVQFEQHHSTWITKADIAEIASYGLNTVRVPVGFWIVNGDPAAFQSEPSKVMDPEQDSSLRTGLSFLDELVFDWATAYNVSVMLSLHSHQGSQNGYDNSAPQVFGEKHWADHDENYQNSIQFATNLAFRYKNATAFLGMNLMNEPHFGDNANSSALVHKYYKHAYQIIRDTGNDCVLVVSPNLVEQTPPYMDNFMRGSGFHNVWHEYHPYFIWGFEGRNEDYLIEAANKYSDAFLAPSKWRGNPILIGEWCLDGPDSAPFADHMKLKAFAQAQLKSFEFAGAGWTFWSWRHDDEASMTSGWSMRQLLRQGDLQLPWLSPNATANVPRSDTTNSPDLPNFPSLLPQAGGHGPK